MLTPLLAIAPFLAPLVTQVLVVDDDGGPGVDFTSIADAVLAAAPGDVVLVAAGTYGPFVIDQPLTVIGSGEATVVTGDSAVLGTLATDAVAIANLRLEGIALQSCEGPVVLADVSRSWRIGAEFCADARLFRVAAAGWVASASLSAAPGVRALDSRVEIVACHRMGEGGKDGTGKDGAEAVLAEGTSRVDLVASHLEGGIGSTVLSGYAGSGGVGLRVVGPAAVRLIGTNVRGGLPGWTTSWPNCAYDGSAGTAVVTDVRVMTWRPMLHGTGFQWGAPCFSSVSLTWLGAEAVVPSIAPPTLGLEGEPVASATLAATVTGEVGASVRLFASKELVVQPTPGVELPRLVGDGPSFDLGPIPVTGTLTASFTLPAEWELGTIAGLQAEVQGAGALQRSNSVPIVVR